MVNEITEDDRIHQLGIKGQKYRLVLTKGGAIDESKFTTEAVECTSDGKQEEASSSDQTTGVVCQRLLKYSNQEYEHSTQEEKEPM